MLGYTWFFNTWDGTGGVAEILNNAYKFSEAIIGTPWNGDLGPPQSYPVPYHFGCNNSSKIAESTKARYLILTSLEVRTYTNVWQSTDYFTTEDFKHLLNDTSIDLSYSNGDITIYYLLTAT